MTPGGRLNIRLGNLSPPTLVALASWIPVLVAALLAQSASEIFFPLVAPIWFCGVALQFVSGLWHFAAYWQGE